MQVLWFNTSISSYETGTWSEFKTKQSNSAHTEDILALEKYRDTPSETLVKIAKELNKCRLSRLR